MTPRELHGNRETALSRRECLARLSPTIQQCVQHFFNFVFPEDFNTRENHFAAILIMGSIFFQASVLCIVLLSVISVALCDTSNMDDSDSSDAASAVRRLLQKTVYNMPKLNFCELIQTKMPHMRLILILFVRSETSINFSCHMRNVRHRLRFQAAEFAMLRVVSFFCQKMFPNSGTNHSDLGSSEIAESNRIYEPVSL